MMRTRPRIVKGFFSCAMDRFKADQFQTGLFILRKGLKRAWFGDREYDRLQRENIRNLMRKEVT